jgi:hypothetical protein
MRIFKEEDGPFIPSSNLGSVFGFQPSVGQTGRERLIDTPHAFSDRLGNRKTVPSRTHRTQHKSVLLARMVG